MCDEVTDTCVECLYSTEHCAAPTAACDPEGHACVECVETADCSEGVCDPAMHQCVECLEHEDCVAPTALCDAEHFCVECLENEACTDTTASWCEAGSCSPCQTHADCSHLEGVAVCDAGTCVECTGTEYASCGANDAGKPLVCDSKARSCSEQVEGSVGLCGDCVSDASCKQGMRCIQERFLSNGTLLGYVCAWERGAEGAPASCSTARPYAQARLAVMSIDGAEADMCALRVSTCQAHADFSAKNCETEVADATDDTLCGEPALNDGICELQETVGDDNVYRCTVPCGSDDDCRTNFACDIEADPPRCNLHVGD